MDAEDPLPEGVVPRPEFLPGAVLLYEAFWELNTERALAPGIFGPIRTTAILAWEARLGFTGTPLQATFLEAIRALDDIWVDYVFTKIEKANGSTPNKTEPQVVNTPMNAELFDSLF